jgi:hypothetical protein
VSECQPLLHKTWVYIDGRPGRTESIRDIIEGEDIVGFVKAQRLRWFGHVQRRDTQHILRKTLNWRPVEGRPRGRPRIRWEDQIHEDIRRIGIEDWRIKIQDRKNWEKNIRAAREQGRI